MDTLSDAYITEDLTRLVAQDVGSDEPDLTTNDLSYVDLDDLFATHSSSAEPQAASAPEITVVRSPLDTLKEIILSLDWELTDKNITKCLAEIDALQTRWADDQYCSTLLKLLATIAKYIGDAKENAHPDSIKVLNSAYVCLERIVSALSMAEDEKHGAVSEELHKFKTLRQKIALKTQSVNVAGKGQDAARTTEPLLALKAMVLGIDWGEIDQQRIDIFYAEISALKEKWGTDKTLVQGLEILRAYGQYIFSKKGKAHPDSFKQFISSYNSLERVVATDSLSQAAKEEIIALELQKFISLKQQIVAAGKGPEPRAKAPAEIIEKAPAHQPSPATKAASAPPKAAEVDRASFLTDVDDRLDNFFMEKDAASAGELWVAELPMEGPLPTADGAPAAMIDETALPADDNAPAMFMEEIAPPADDSAPAMFMQEIAPPADDNAPAMFMQEVAPPVDDSAPAMFMQEIAPPADDNAPAMFMEEVAPPADDSAPAMLMEEIAPPAELPSKGTPSPPAAHGSDELMAEALPLTKKADRQPARPDQEISVADETVLAELQEAEESLIASDKQPSLCKDVAAGTMTSAGDILAAAKIRSQQTKKSGAEPVAQGPTDFGRMKALSQALLRHCPDAALADFRQELSGQCDRWAAIPLAGIGLDLLDTMAAQLEVIPEQSRADSAVPLAALYQRLEQALIGPQGGSQQAGLAAVQSICHDYTVWQKASIQTMASLPSRSVAVANHEAAPVAASHGPEPGPEHSPPPAPSFFAKVKRLLGGS